MLFNSYIFLFAFLPVTLLGYQLAGYFHRRAVIAWLGLASLGFYAYWKPAFLFVLLASITMNYGAAWLIDRSPKGGVSSSRWLWAAIAANLALLGYFKYLFPLLGFLGHVSGSPHAWTNVALPLGISFFTFTQIAFLVDLQQGVAKRQSIDSYILFVTFFPHLIAGPILHHKEMMPQFQQERRYRLNMADIAVGFSWFIMGLAKKALVADTFAQTADAAFRVHGILSPGFAWHGSLCYALQLYFDFSGYSDMALGLARMFSINFPLNFNSPYKAASMIDFWRRWHITLSNYIMDYLYSPLQFKIFGWRRDHGKPTNKSALRTASGFATMVAFPMMFTMGVAGVWHGPGLQYILYGVLHGLFLTTNHAWTIFRGKRPAGALPVPRAQRVVLHGASVLLTFLCVLVTLIFFRGEGLAGGWHMLSSMAGIGRSHVASDGVQPFSHIELLQLAAGFVVVWFLPNIQQILRGWSPSLNADNIAVPHSARWLRWSPTYTWAIVLGVLFFSSLLTLQNPSTFLYFQF